MGFWKALTGKTWKETISGGGSSTPKKDDKKKSTTLGQVSQTGQYAGDGFEWVQNDNTNALTRVYTGAGKDNNLGTDVKIAGASDKNTKNAISAISANEGSVFATTKASGTTGIPFIDEPKSFAEEQGISYTPTITYDSTKTGAENDAIRAQQQQASVPDIKPQPRPEPPVATPEELVIPEVTVDPITGLTTEQTIALANEAIDSAPDFTYSPVTPTGGPGTFAPGALPAGSPDAFDPRGNQLVSPTGTGIGVTPASVGANDQTDALLNLTAGIGSGAIGLDEADATLKLIEGDTLTDDDITALMPPTTRDDFTYVPTGGPGTFTPSGIGATGAAATAQDNNPNADAAGITSLGTETTELSSPDFAIPGTNQAAYATSGAPVEVGGEFDPRTILPTSEQMAELEGTAQEAVDLTPDAITLGDLTKSLAVGVPSNLSQMFGGLADYQASNPVQGTGNLALDLGRQIMLRTQPQATQNLILSQDPEARREKAAGTRFISDKLQSGADALSEFFFPDGRPQAVVTGTTPSDLAIQRVEGSGGIPGVANVTAEEVGGGVLDVLGAATPQTRAISGALNIGEQISGTQATAEQALNQLVASGALDDNQVYKDVLEAQGGDAEKAKQALVDAVIYRSAPQTASTGVVDALIPKIGSGFLGLGKDLAVRANVEGGQEVAESAIALNALNNVLGLEGENKQQIFQDAAGNYVMGSLAGGGTSVVAAPAVAGIQSLAPTFGGDPRVTNVPAGMNMTQLGALNLGQAPGGGAPNVTILNPSLSPTAGQLAASTVPTSYTATQDPDVPSNITVAEQLMMNQLEGEGAIDVTELDGLGLTLNEVEEIANRVTAEKMDNDATMLRAIAEQEVLDTNTISAETIDEIQEKLDPDRAAEIIQQASNNPFISNEGKSRIDLALESKPATGIETAVNVNQTEETDQTEDTEKEKVTITPVTVDDRDTTVPAVTSEITPTTDQTTDVKVQTEVGEFPEPEDEEVEVEVEDEVDPPKDEVEVEVKTPMVVPPETRTNDKGEEIIECPDGYTMVQTAEGPICQKTRTAVRQRAGAGTRAYTSLATRGQRGPGQRRITITDTERVDPITRSA